MKYEPQTFWKERLVLVTGGAGFVGSNLVQRLLELGAKVTVLDDFFTGERGNLPTDADGLCVLEGSVTEFDVLKQAMEGADCVFHEAARNIVVSTKNPREDFEVNIGGTLNVLIIAKELGTRRVVYASSASVYGNARYLPCNEDDTTNMLSPYAVSKYAGENYCKAFYESYGVSAASVRYSNVYGRMQRVSNPYCGVVSKFFSAAMNNEPIRIHGDGEQTRDFTYVRDAVEATLLAGQAEKASGAVYNVGVGREVTINQLAQQIVSITGSSSSIEQVDRRDIDNIRRRVMNIERIRGELRWWPTYTLDKGLRTTYEWLKSEPEGR